MFVIIMQAGEKEKNRVWNDVASGMKFLETRNAKIALDCYTNVLSRIGSFLLMLV